MGVMIWEKILPGLWAQLCNRRTDTDLPVSQFHKDPWKTWLDLWTVKSHGRSRPRYLGVGNLVGFPIRNHKTCMYGGCGREHL